MNRVSTLGLSLYVIRYKQMKFLKYISILLFCCLIIFNVNGLYGVDKSTIIRRTIEAKDICALDKEILKLTKAAAAECADVFKKALDQGVLSEEEVFSTLYFPILPLRSPPTFTTFYDTYTDKLVTPIEDKYLASRDDLVFVVLVDKNGYLPSHNTKYSQKLTGDRAQDLKINRTKRIFNDITGFSAAKNKKEFLLQIYSRDTGEIMADLSVPVFVLGRHWGAVRIGYIREK
jgi:hypothetical protein